MSKKSRRPTKKTAPLRPAEHAQILQHQQLKRELRRHREIQSMVKQLARASAKATGELESFVRGYAAAMGFDLVACEERKAANG